MPGKSKRKKQPERAECEAQLMAARREARWWDAVYFGSRLFHAARIWQEKNYSEEIRFADQMRDMKLITPQEYHDEVAWHEEYIAGWRGEAGVRQQIGPDLARLALDPRTEKQLIDLIVDWSAESGVPDLLKETMDAFRAQHAPGREEKA